jgi:hypothetical protein
MPTSKKFALVWYQFLLQMEKCLSAVVLNIFNGGPRGFSNVILIYGIIYLYSVADICILYYGNTCSFFMKQYWFTDVRRPTYIPDGIYMGLMLNRISRRLSLRGPIR